MGARNGKNVSHALRTLCTPPRGRRCFVMEESESDSDGCSDGGGGKPGTFTEEVHEVLQTLYRRGMNGWGKKHSPNRSIAMARTGLNLSQIKVL